MTTLLVVLAVWCVVATVAAFLLGGIAARRNRQVPQRHGSEVRR